MNKNKKILGIGLLTATLCTGVIINVTSANKRFLSVLSAENTYSVSLNESNAPTLTGSVVTHDLTPYMQFTYEGGDMSTGAGKHITMTGGGKISTSKQIRGIKQIEVNVSDCNATNEAKGRLILYVGYSMEDVTAKKYAYAIYGTGINTIDTNCNYFAFESALTYTINSLKINYECASDLSKAEVPTGSDMLNAKYGGAKKAVTNDGNGGGTILDAQSQVVNADGLFYNYKYMTFSVDLKFPTALLATTNDYNVGIQLHKYINFDGGVNAAIQFSIKNFSTGTWALKVSGSERTSGALSDKGITLNGTDYFTFKVVTTFKSAATTVLKCYINDVLISQTDRGSLAKDLYYTGIRYSTGSFGAISFRNLSLTGHN